MNERLKKEKEERERIWKASAMKMRRMTKLAMMSSKLMKSSSPKHDWETFEEFIDDSGEDTDGCSPNYNRYQYLFG